MLQKTWFYLCMCYIGSMKCHFIMLLLSMLTHAVVFNKAFLTTRDLLSLWTDATPTQACSADGYFYCVAGSGHYFRVQARHVRADAGGGLTKLFMGGSGLILRPAQPPFLCQRPLEGRMPSQRLRPAFPMMRLLWSTFDTLPTVATQVSNTWEEGWFPNNITFKAFKFSFQWPKFCTKTKKIKVRDKLGCWLEKAWPDSFKSWNSLLTCF